MIVGPLPQLSGFITVICGKWSACAACGGRTTPAVLLPAVLLLQYVVRTALAVYLCIKVHCSANLQQ